MGPMEKPIGYEESRRRSSGILVIIEIVEGGFEEGLEAFNGF